MWALKTMTGVLVRDKEDRREGRGGGHMEDEAEAGGMWPESRNTWSPGSWDRQEGFFLP